VETFTFLLTDIAGSTAMLRRLGDSRYVRVLTDHHALIRSGSASGSGWVCIPVRPPRWGTSLVGLDVHRAARIAAVG
jgi:hypothetical protein